MKKKLIFAYIIAVLCLSVSLYAGERGIYDNAGLLSEADKAGLEKQIEQIAANYNFDLIILTQKSIGKEDAGDYSWRFLDSKGISGDTWDGCLFLRSMQYRDYEFTASGRGYKRMNAFAKDKLKDIVVPYLKKDDYFGAFDAYIRFLEKVLVLETKGNTYNPLHETTSHIGLLSILWVLAFCVGLIVVYHMKKAMNTVLPKAEANAYIIPGSMVLTNQSDKFLYSTTTRVKRESSSSGGGSSRSGGGRSSWGGRA